MPQPAQTTAADGQPGTPPAPPQPAPAVPATPDVQADGYPADTPLAEMSTEQQLAYWKAQARKHETVAKQRRDYDQIRTELDQVKASTQTETEKAIAEAKTAARTEVLIELGSKLVDVHVAAAVTGGRLTQDQADAFLESVDRTKFLTDDGDVDTDKLASTIGKFSPAGADPHQGNRGGSPGSTTAQAGRDEATRRYGKK